MGAGFPRKLKTPGVVIKEIMQARDADWEHVQIQGPIGSAVAPAERFKDRAAPAARGVKQADGAAPASAAKLQTEGHASGKGLHHTLKNGGKLCKEFQKGQCKQSVPCKDGRHVCAVILKGRRLCGGKHPAAKCRMKGSGK